MSLFTRQDALDYHTRSRAGKLEVLPSKPCRTQKDLSLAYSPGVAEACLAIKEDAKLSYTYTGRANLVAVVSNGTAVLGLGNIGPEAGKPVMEGKGVLFKAFADVDCYDINLKVTDPDSLCEIVKALEPTFGGINLEDIRAPECFYIEDRLKREMNIPVFHDDQHGTAIISGAGLLGALEIAHKRIEDIRVIISGAGAAGIACANFYLRMGVQPNNIAMFDSRGHIHKGRTDLTAQKQPFATKKSYANLAEAFKGADMFLGLSQPNIVSKEMVASMAAHPVIFACANPVPEISYQDAKEARPDAIIGTGRSDYPNQINNVSGFPYIFRGALDVRASEITEEMKLAATHALARLAKEPVPAEVLEAYEVNNLTFGLDYIIPKPLDPRLITHVSTAVAQSALACGVAQQKLDLNTYPRLLQERMKSLRARMDAILKLY